MSLVEVDGHPPQGHFGDSETDSRLMGSLEETGEQSQPRGKWWGTQEAGGSSVGCGRGKGGVELPEEHTLGLAHNAVPQTWGGIWVQDTLEPNTDASPCPCPPPLQSWHSHPPPRHQPHPAALWGRGPMVFMVSGPSLLCGCTFPGSETRGPRAPSLPPASAVQFAGCPRRLTYGTHMCLPPPLPRNQAVGPVLTGTQPVHRCLPLALRGLLTDLRQWPLQTPPPLCLGGFGLASPRACWGWGYRSGQRSPRGRASSFVLKP